MSNTPRSVRMLALASTFAILAIALGIRAAADGPLEQHSGTALYASLIYAIVVFFWPRLTPFATGAIALGFCWLVELAQLTPVPAALSERSLLARLALGAHFDPIDLAWYPIGVAPMVAIHWLALSLARDQAKASS